MRHWVFHLNPLALFVCTISSFLTSTIWYGPLLGNLWLEYSHLNLKKIEDHQRENKYLKLFIGIAGTLLSTIIYSLLIHNIPIRSISDMVLLAALLVGLIGMNAANGVIWGRRKIEYALINLGYQLVNLIVQGLIILILEGEFLEGTIGSSGIDDIKVKEL